MCGLAGLYRPSNATFSRPSKETVALMVRTLAHRGPDAEGLWEDDLGRCVLGHRRLSIIDTSDAGLQPMVSGNGRFVISYNGELYNYLAIRSELESAGIRFKGRTDTEVLLEAVAFWGVEAFGRFDGMFAVAVFDTLTGELVLARDPFGEKPLYYSQLSDGTVAFGSELHALERVPQMDLTVSVDAMAEVLTFQYIGAPRTIYRSIKKLRPGHWLKIWPNGRTQTGRYFSFQPRASENTRRPLSDLADELEDILVRSIERRMIGDVPLGAFLSGGVDSSTVCALIRRRLNLPLVTFSTGFDGAPESEHLVAREFAEHLGTTHFDQLLTPDAAEFLLNFGKIVDEPNGDSSCLPTYLLSEFARKHVTVAISGDGGDEMFGGYGRYFNTLEQLRQYQNGDLKDWKPGAAYYGGQVLVASEPDIEEIFGFVPEAFADHVGCLRTELDERQDRLLAAMRRTDTENYMPGAVLSKVDRMSMQHSLEVRTPFLNVDIARFAERLHDQTLVQGGRGKLILKEISYRYLPRELVDLPKRGFALPMSDWAKDSLLQISSQVLESDDSRLAAMFGPSGLSRFLDRQRTPGRFSPYQLWGLVALESWLRQHPATLPSFAGETRRAQSAHSEPALMTFPLRSDLFLIARAESKVSGRLASVPVEIERIALELLSSPSGEGSEATGSIIRIADWHGNDADGPQLTDLKGATLLFADADAALHFDYAEIERFRSFGVARLILRHPDVDGELLDLQLHATPSTRELLKLFRQRTALVSTASAYRLLGAKLARQRGEGSWQSSLIHGIDPIPDVELSAEFMLFEGKRQLPPLPASHKLIAEKRGGRYSVFDQVLTFAPTEPGRERMPYWLVRRSAEDDRLLPTSIGYLRQSPPAADSIDDLKASIRDVSPGPSVVPGERIIVCTHSLAPGGAERQWVYLAQALSEAGFEVTFVTFRGTQGVNAHYADDLRRTGIPHVDASDVSVVDQLRAWPKDSERRKLFSHPLVPDRETVAKLVAVFRDVRPKALITQLDDPNLIGGLAAHVADVPKHIMSFRNYNPTNFAYIAKDWYKPAYQVLCSSNRTILTGNHYSANEDYAEWIGIDSSSIEYIPNAIDFQSFTRATDNQTMSARSELDLASDTPIILGVMRLSAEKDPATFVNVCEHVFREHPTAEALLVGAGRMRPQIEEQIERLGLTRRIRLLGPRTDVNVLMSVANLVLLTSRFEGMPNVVLEAQSIGVPVVVTSAGASSELVQNGVNGFVRPVGDTNGLAAACLTVLRDPQLAARLGQEGRALVQKRYSKERLAERYIALLGDADRSGFGANPRTSRFADQPAPNDPPLRLATK